MRLLSFCCLVGVSYLGRTRGVQQCRYLSLLWMPLLSPAGLGTGNPRAAPALVQPQAAESSWAGTQASSSFQHLLSWPAGDVDEGGGGADRGHGGMWEVVGAGRNPAPHSHHPWVQVGQERLWVSSHTLGQPGVAVAAASMSLPPFVHCLAPAASPGFPAMPCSVVDRRWVATPL